MHGSVEQHVAEVRPDARLARRVVLLITPDLALAERLATLLNEEAASYQLPLVMNVNQARGRLNYSTPGGPFARPCVILLDDQALREADRAAAVVELAAVAPVVALARSAQALHTLLPRDAGMEVQLDPDSNGAGLRGMFRAGRLDVVPWKEDSLPLLVALLERHACREVLSTSEPLSGEFANVAEDFGEVFRHEVNNPLTGILGNAELLLARRDQMSTVMVSRLETIAELAIRLRETVRRLSNEWMARFSSTARVPKPR